MENKIKQAITVIDSFSDDLNHFLVKALRDGKFGVVRNDLERWRVYVANEIAEKISQYEATCFQDKYHGKYEPYYAEDLQRQIKDYQKYLISLKNTLENKPDLILSETKPLSQSDQVAYNNEKGSEVSTSISNRVFVVHGRNLKIKDAMFTFLNAIGVKPIEWSEAKRKTGKASPYIGEILDAAFSLAQAVIVLFTPDDEARLKKEFQTKDDQEYEKKLTPQARPNVIFEAGMAFGLHENRTIIIEFGQLRPFSDVAGRHIIKFNEPSSRYAIVQLLETVGVEVDIKDKEEWLTVGDFSIKDSSDGREELQASNIIPENKQKDLDQTEEKGFWDFVVEGEEALQILTKCMEEINEATTTIGERMRQNTNELLNIKDGNLPNKSSKIYGLTFIAAKALVQYAEKLNEKESIFKIAFRSFFDNTTGFIKYSRIFTEDDKKRIIEYRNIISELQKIIRYDIVQSKKFETTIINLKGISHEVNKASRKAAKALNLLTDDFNEVDISCTKLLQKLDEKMSQEGYK